MKRENNCIAKFFMPVLYAIFIYVIWEVTGICASYVIRKITGSWEDSLYSTYIIMLLNEISTFVIIYILFHKKAHLVKRENSDISLLPVLAMIILPLIQICNDIITILHGQRVFSLLSSEGICFLVICFVACLSTGLLEEYVWRGIILNGFLSVWGKTTKGIYISILMSSACFGLCHYTNLLAGQDFITTTQQVISAACMGVFLSALLLNTNHLAVPILVHGLCNFSNFLMNEILGWNYSLWKYDDIFQRLLAIGYLTVGLYLVYRYEKTNTGRYNSRS